VFRTPDDEWWSCKRDGSASVARLRARYAKPASQPDNLGEPSKASQPPDAISEFD
jgi:hypothetical protein